MQVQHNSSNLFSYFNFDLFSFEILSFNNLSVRISSKLLVIPDLCYWDKIVAEVKDQMFVIEKCFANDN